MEVKVIKFSETDITISVNGRVNSTNAEEFLSLLEQILDEHPVKKVLLDVKNLEMISSAGLRAILRLTKQGYEVRITNVNETVYQVFEMTGFTELMRVDRPVRKIVLDEDAEVIGHGANSTVYRYRGDTVIKVLREGYSEDAIVQELDKTRRAFVMGIPTVIPFAVVEANGKPGVAFELVEAKSLTKLIIENEDNINRYIDQYVDSVRRFHEIEATDADRKIYTDANRQMEKYIKDLEGYSDPDIIEKMQGIIEEFAEGNRILHGDIHPNNVMVTEDQMIYIDMDTLSYGNPEFDLVYLYNALAQFNLINPIEEFFGFGAETAQKIWDQFLRHYFNDKDEEFIQRKQKLYEVLGLCRLYRWSMRHAADRPDAVATVKKAFEKAVSDY